MMSKYFLKPAIAIAMITAAFFITSFLKKTSVPAILEQCTCKEQAKPDDDGAVKGDLFFWESITRNFASIR